MLLNSPAIHSAIVVARVDKTPRDDVRRARAILDRHMVEPVGIVVTGLRDSARYGFEAYGPTGPAVDGDIHAPISAESTAAPRLRA